MKKVLSIVLTLALVLGMFVGIELPVSAATSGTTGDCTWTLDGTKLTISGNGAMWNYDYEIEGCGPWGRDITEVVIEYGVTNIGESAFNCCEMLTSVIIPNSVTWIGDYAFYECTGLTSVNIPNSVTSIGGHTFSYCTGLTSITIPDGVTSIGYEAFSYCTSLTSVTIPDSVTSIVYNVFYDTAYYNNNANWENDVLCIDNHLIEAKTYISGEYNIKAGTLTLADGAFSDCESLTSITIPDSVTSISNYAFSGCTGLTSVTIPDSVTSIGWDAFSYCTNFTDVWYTGSEADRAEITIGSYNDALLNATWHYNYGKLVVGEDIEIVDGKVKVPATSGYFTDKNGKLYFPGEYIDAEAGDVFTPAPIEVAADNAFSIRKDSIGIRARGALSKETVEAASEIGFVIVPRIALDLSADWYVSSQYTYKQRVSKNAIYGTADEVDGYQYQLCLWNLKGVEAEDFLFAMYATVNGVTTYTYVGCVSYEMVNGAVSK